MPKRSAPTDQSSATDAARWLLLIHQIPPKPDYLRVKVGRRLQSVGAVALKNSVYALPDTPKAREDFEWVRTEIVDGGGDAYTCRAEFVGGITDEQIRRLFRDARAADFEEIAGEARAALEALGRSERSSRTKARGSMRTGRGRPADDLERLRKRFAAASALDFFGIPEQRAAQAAIDALAARLEPRPRASAVATTPLDRREYRGRTWVTRADVFVDRIASAWLITRFIDPAARFKFVSAERYRPRSGEVRFDMFEAELTHEDDRCTFETIRDRFALDDPALGVLGEIVHEIDLKDGKFERPETAGVEQMIQGVAAAHATDAARLERGGQLFDDLYAHLSREAGWRPPSRRRAK